MSHTWKLNRILETLQKVDSKLGTLEKMVHELSQPSRISLAPDVETIVLSLPSHLQRTLLALNKYPLADAYTVGRLTGVSRCIANQYLLELIRLGMVNRTNNKTKKGRICYLYSVVLKDPKTSQVSNKKGE